VSDSLHQWDPERFQDVHRIGAGNNATVYCAWDRDLERHVALKVSMADTLLDILGNDRLAALGIADGLQQFVHEIADATRSRYTLLREARLLARVHHPNVVAVLDVGVLDGSLTLVMPYLAGGQLDDKAVDGPWPRVLELGLAIGEGLAALHDAGLMHRDFKPNNVLFDAEGRPCIVDLGLACRIDDAAALAEWPGTSAYMAPETLARRHRDQRDDLYAFCVVVFQMLYGHMPFASDAARRAGEVSRIERRGAPPAAVRMVLARGLHPDLERRWPDMRVLLAELRQAALPRRRRLRALAGAGAGAVGIALAAAFTVVLSSSSDVWADACEQVSGELDTIWNRDIALELRGAVSRRSSDALDDWAGRWLAVRARECERERERGELPIPPPSPCVERQRQQFETTVAVLRHASEREGLDYAAVIDELPAPERCLEQRGEMKPETVGLLALREHDVEIAAWIAADELELARSRLDEYVALAREYGSEFDLARAALRRGQIDRRAALRTFPGSQAYGEAERRLQFAYERASAIGAETLAAEAMLELLALAGERGQRDALHVQAVVARAAFERLDPDRVAEVLVLHGLGLIEGSQEEREQAVELLREAVDMRERQHARFGGSRELIAEANQALAKALLSVGQLQLAYVTAERSFDIDAAIHGGGSEQALASKRLMFAARVRLGHNRFDDPLSGIEDLMDDFLADKDPMALADEYLWIASVYDDAGATKVALKHREIAEVVGARAACGVPQTPW
jgi:serine/threonine protein kinase/tetratricopeptide (TPR) repeat protein